LLKPKGSIDARQYAAAFVTQCTLSLNTGRKLGWAGQCGSFVMFCAPNAKIRSIRKILHSEKFLTVSDQSDFGIIRAYFDLQGATARAHSGMWGDGMRVSEKITRWSCRMQHPMTCPYVGLHAGAQKQAAARMVRRFSTTGTGMEQGQKDLYLVCVHLFIIHVTHRDKSCLTYVHTCFFNKNVSCHTYHIPAVVRTPDMNIRIHTHMNTRYIQCTHAYVHTYTPHIRHKCRVCV